MSIPKVFISYSHDSQEHKQWVLEFATRLRNSGVDAILDQWELQPGDDLPHFMEQNLASSDRVLMICTERYVGKANSGSGGVGYEKMIVTADLMRTIDSNKVIPLIRQAGTHETPTFLKSKLFIDFSSDDQTEFSFDELIRTLHGTPLFVKPPVGNSPFIPVLNNPPERQGDAILELMKSLVRIFERQNEDYLSYSELRADINISRLMLDVLIEQAKEDGLITQGAGKLLYLTTKGKQYAIFHKL
ncbi:toll/interleukin-1 receptor domain-containing protein [Pseudomonas sp. FP1742]|uniref:toll/interleukin-1 receptor domain-containing protein n=1 Tax=Pseudomonas sp. FP1742 TaxID=2954079 RepID=UPI002734C91B|nr:toll/interleukin-1 receptor domain-containing protein [Pseudomonas sp. FP1742]WLG51617.1 toll/interleukin-1 receptor domain-containing protein [Pseudomonas sp. FP1742]